MRFGDRKLAPRERVGVRVVVLQESKSGNLVCVSFGGASTSYRYDTSRRPAPFGGSGASNQLGVDKRY